ncbi:MAG: 6-bladed beta-propeller [Balneolaceae bacterium]|nr:6-bladed beta-propeller [Balneolaceae bacterium]
MNNKWIKSYSYLIIWITLFFMYSCGAKKDASLKKILHPSDNARIVHSQYEPKTVFNSDIKNLFDLDSLLDVESAYYAIKNYQDDEYVAVDVVDADVNGSENLLYLVDKKLGKVNAFDLSGDYRFSIGRKGRGPGEFILPSALARVNNHLLVLDKSFKVESFKATNGEHHKSYQLGYSPLDICAIGTSIFVYGFSFDNGDIPEDKLVHKYEMTTNGELIYSNSFGDLYPGNSQMISSALSVGKLECLESTGDILLVNQWFPFVSLFDKNGNQKIKFRFEDYSQRRIEEIISQGQTVSYTVNRAESKVHNFIDIKRDELSQTFLLQYTFGADQTNETTLKKIVESTEYYTVEINPIRKSAKLVSMDKNFPLLFVSKNFVLSLKMDFKKKEPNIVIYERKK